MKNIKFIVQLLMLNLLIMIPIYSFGQDLVCSSSSYENINANEKFTKKSDTIISIKIEDNKIFAEISSSFTRKTYKNTYVIESRYENNYLAYEILNDKTFFLASTLSLSLDKMIATYIVFGSTDVSVNILKCMSK